MPDLIFYEIRQLILMDLYQFTGQKIKDEKSPSLAQDHTSRVCPDRDRFLFFPKENTIPACSSYKR
jgi:hypothetical protein